MLRTFSELIQLETFEERYRYLALRGVVGEATFGADRWMNQQFYQSAEWKQIRRHVIIRDAGCDLALPGYEIFNNIYIHHMNPMTPDGIIHRDETNLDPEFLISCSLQTHNAIHYGDEKQLPRPFVPRSPGDTKLW